MVLSSIEDVWKGDLNICSEFLCFKVEYILFEIFFFSHTHRRETNHKYYNRILSFILMSWILPKHCKRVAAHPVYKYSILRASRRMLAGLVYLAWVGWTTGNAKEPPGGLSPKLGEQAVSLGNIYGWHFFPWPSPSSFLHQRLYNKLDSEPRS